LLSLFTIAFQLSAVRGSPEETVEMAAYAVPIIHTANKSEAVFFSVCFTKVMFVWLMIY
jgi:hypothetical protein